MVCLLCFECTGDQIILSSVEGDKSKISSVLFKYFRFMFESEPDDGEICRKCWMKVEMFHSFYQHIEEIQMTMTMIKLDPLVVESFDIQIKLEDGSSNTTKDVKCESNDRTDFSNDDHHTDLDDSYWYTDFDHDNQPETSTSSATVDNIKSEEKPDPDDSAKATIVKSKTTKKQPKKYVFLGCRHCYVKERAVKLNSKGGSTSECPGKIPDLHICPINQAKCLKKFETKDALIAHCAMDHRRFHCTHCPNVRLFADLYKHLRDIHGIIENAICEHCGQIFGCNRTLLEHIRRKHTVNDPVQCDICKEWFKSRETIRSHMVYVHIQGPQTCSICGKVSANRKALRTHLTIHSEAWKDKYKCVICGKGFRSSTKQREHSYIHSGKTDAYVCQYCGKSFRFNSSISAHRMKYHPAEMAHVKERLQRKRNMEFKV